MVDDTLLYTLAQPNSLQQEIKKSRFLAHAGAVDSIEAAMAFVAGHGVAAANHNCWAYQVGDAYRFSDDGEPAGTAGRPILHAIESRSEEHTSELQSLMRISYAVFCLKKKNKTLITTSRSRTT